MATLQQAVTAFKNAHAAGDTTAATKLAALVRKLQTGTRTVAEPVVSLSDEELRARYGLKEPTPEGPTVLGELGRGFEQYLASGETALGALLGDEEAAARRGLERQQQIAEEYGEGPSFGRLKDIYEKEGLLSAAGSAISQVPELIAQQVPQLAATAALAKAGAMAGTAIAPGAGTIIGGGLGALASVIPQLAGSDILRQAEETPESIDVGKAYGAAALQAAPELLGQYFTVGKGFVKGLLGIADDVGLDSAAARNLTGAAIAKLRGEAAAPLYKAGLRAAAVEMPTEVAQQIIERAQAGLELFSSEALAEYGEAVYAAGMVAGPLGTVGGVGDRRAATSRLQEIAEQEKQDEFAAQREQLDLGGQMELVPDQVLSPETAAGAAQQEAARQQALLGEEYTTRAGEQRFAPPGTFAKRNLPIVVQDQQVFDEMKARKLTQAASIDMLSDKEKQLFGALKTNMNEAAIMGQVAAEAPRIPRAEGEAPLTIDPSKPISELSGEEVDVLNRVLDRLEIKGRQPKGKGQMKLPKSYLPLVGEAAVQARKLEAEKLAAQQQKEAERAAGQADMFGEPTTPAKPAAPAATAPTAPTKLSVLPTDRASLRKLIPSAHPDLVIFAENGPLAGRDLSDPAVAAQVKTDLETAAQKYSGKNATAVEKFLQRPEFQIKQPNKTEDTTEAAEDLGGGETEANLGMAFESTAPDERRKVVRRVEIDPEDIATAEKLAAQEVPAERITTGEQAAAMFFRAYEPASALRVMVAEGVPKYTETETVPDKTLARKAAKWVADNMSPAANEAIVKHAKDFQNILSRNKVTAKKRAVRDEIDEAKAAAREEKAEQETTKKVDAALRKQEAETVPTRKLDSATRAALKELDARGVAQTTALTADTAVARSARPAEKLEEERKLESQKRMFEMMGGKVTQLPYTGPERVRQYLGTMYLENASNSPKLEGDLLAAVQAGNLKKTISLLLDKTAKRPEVQQILRRIQSMGLKTKIVVGAVPEEGLGNVVDLGKARTGRQLETIRNTRLKQLNDPAFMEQVVAEVERKLSELNAYLKETQPPTYEPGQRVIYARADKSRGYTERDVGKRGTLIRQVNNGKKFSDTNPNEAKWLVKFDDDVGKNEYNYYGLESQFDPIVTGKPKRIYAPQRAGSYDPVTDTITLDPELGLNEHTLIHELTHAALASRIADPDSKVAKDFTEFFQIVQNQLGGTYGGTDLQEFAAELMGNEEFATSLKAIKAPKGDNLLQRIVQSIAEFFGLRKGQSAYDAGIKYINQLLNVPASAEPTVVDKLNLGTPTSAIQALEQINKSRKRPSSKELTETLSMMEKADTFAREQFFRLLRMDNIYNMYKDAGSKYQIFTRSLKQLIDSAEKRAAFIENHIDAANKKYKKFTNAARQYSDAMPRMFNMAERARIAGIDLVPGSGFKPTPQQQAEFTQLQAVLNNLPKPVRDMYITMRKDYDAAYTEYREFLLKQYAKNPTLYKEMRAKFEAEHPVTGYVPFMRFGDYVLEYTDPKTNRRTVRQFETDTERQQAISELSTKDYQTYTRMDEATYDPNKIPSGSFLAKAMQDLQKAGATQQQLNAVYQSYLSMFPAESLMKRMMRAENVAGMSDDMIRAYANTMIQWARHMGNALYSPQIDEALASINTQRDVDKNLNAINKVLNSKDSREFLHNPSFSGIVSSLSSISYIAFILGNVASAVINLSSLPLLGLPLFGGKYGYSDATSALAAATKLVTPLALKDMVGADNVWGTMPAKYKKLVAALNDQGQLQHTQTREILAGRQRETEVETNPLRKIGLAAMDYGSRPFSATEKVNRAAIAVAAYDLATKGGNGVKPMTESAAIQYALDSVKQVNTSGMAVTGPQLFQTPIGRVFGTFKTFAWNAAFVVVKSFYDSVKGATPEVRRAATSQFLGTMIMSGALSGVSGMPFIMMVAAAARTLLAAMFGDDEEDEKFITTDEWMRDFVGTLAWKGPLNYYTNLALADRMAITPNLLFREDPKLIDDVGYVRAALIQAVGGPALGYFGNISDGLKLWDEGHYERGFEQMLPSSIANLLKGFRFYTDKSALTKDGKPIMEDVSTYSAVMQGLGIAPADLSDMMVRRGQAMDVQDKVRKRKDRLLDLMWAARQSGDEETFEEAREKLLTLGRQHPGVVKQDTIQRSFRNHAANIRDSVTGLTLDASLRNELTRRFRLEEGGD